MGAQMTRKMILLAALQTARGTPANIVDANALAVDADVEYSPQAEKVDRNIASPTFSKEGSRVGAKWQTLTFKHEAAGAGLGANNVPRVPWYDCLLQACGLTRSLVHLVFRTATTHAFTVGETVSGGVSTATGTLRYVFDDILVIEGVSGVSFQAGETLTGGTSLATTVVKSTAKALQYLPVTARIENQECATIRFHKDGILKTLFDCRGNLGIDCPSGKIARFTFAITGPWADPEDAEIPTPALPDFQPPIFVAAQVKLGSYTPKLTALKIDFGNVIKARADANAPEGIVEHFISDRKVTGSVDPEVDTLTTYNPYQLWRAGTASGLRGQIGQDAGNRWLILVPKLRQSDIKETDRDGIAAYDLAFEATRDSAGDDEIRLYCF